MRRSLSGASSSTTLRLTACVVLIALRALRLFEAAAFAVAPHFTSTTLRLAACVVLIALRALRLFEARR